MTKRKNPNKPQRIEDKDLDETSGGLLAVQKDGDTRMTSTTTTTSHSGSGWVPVVGDWDGDG